MSSGKDDLTVKELDAEIVQDGENSAATLRNFVLSRYGISVHLCNVGASIARILVPSYAHQSTDAVDDIVLGFQSARAMIESENKVYFGSVVGRVANRIAEGKLLLSGGQQYQLETNNGPNHLHGGTKGFSHCIWESDIVDTTATKAVQFSLESDDGDQGYPGKVQVTATYSLNRTEKEDGAVLRLSLKATLCGDKSTPINLAQHSYFNLASHNNPLGVLEHKLSMPSEFYTPTGATCIPTREVRSLSKDPCMDWRVGRIVKDALIDFGIEKGMLSSEEAMRNVALSGVAPDLATTAKNSPTLGEPYGFDHNYVINRVTDGMNVAGVLEHAPTKRRLTVVTDAPGVQLYTANWIDGISLEKSLCKDFAIYRQWQGLCLETQHFPDSIDVDGTEHPDFAKGRCFILRPGGPDYEHNVEYRFESM